MSSEPTEGYSYGLVQAVCDVLGQTQEPGLSGAEIDKLLGSIGTEARDRNVNKRTGLFDALYGAQRLDGRIFIRFITRAMAPERYVKDRQRFEDLRQQLNEVMIFHKLVVNEKGRIARALAKATTLSEGAKLAGRLHTELRHRAVHDLLFTYCSEELVNKSLFHAISEAAKSIPNRVREMTGLIGDGWALYNAAFGHRDGKNRTAPRLFINDYLTESDQIEHEGFRSLLVGVHGHYRNPRAHSNRIHREEDLNDFLDAMSLFSYIHKRLDTAQPESATA
ncbi:TIGR02391 family protein [Arthrobacter sp. KK5.5]|uniref:TIGR02391 family protein n=1 Tax=Arthrobacter sp. KK5.5 TaxID=3373084 RepID=UPI003EE5E392